MKRIPAGVSLIVLAGCAAFAQTNAPAFEVATVKPAAPQEVGRVVMRMGGDPSRVNYTNVSLKDVLARAYNLKPYQVSGPSWINTERYDITAKVPDGVPKEQIPLMLQALLADRFKMTVHKESKEESVYALVVGKNGPKLKKSEMGDEAPPKTIDLPTGEKFAAPRGGMMIATNGTGGAQLQANRTTIAQFSDMLSRFMDRPVMDMTGIEGNYDIALDVSMEDLAGMNKMAPAAAVMRGGPAGGGDHGPAPDSAPASSIFTSVQQLGLKLEPRKAPVERIVVDKGERVPTEN
jgi:uncharacterized protein (TIGR03435 family)